MMIYLVGDRGSGKSLVAAWFANKTKKKILNFPLYKNFPKNKQEQKSYKRLKVKHVFKPKDLEAKRQMDKFEVNFDYWENKKNYSVFIDESYTNFSNRRSGSMENILWSAYLSQTRKMLGNQGKQIHLEKLFRMNPMNFNKYMKLHLLDCANFWAISQTVRKTDVDFRELVNILIVVEQIKLNGLDVTQCSCYKTNLTENAIDNFMWGNKPKVFFIDNREAYGLWDTDYFTRTVNVYEQESYL